ncbi:MAG: hypothetical protein ACRDSR_01960 [Pseudonocardiaceae bacterium]
MKQQQTGRVIPGHDIDVTIAVVVRQPSEDILIFDIRERRKGVRSITKHRPAVDEIGHRKATNRENYRNQGECQRDERLDSCDWALTSEERTEQPDQDGPEQSFGRSCTEESWHDGTQYTSAGNQHEPP